MASNKAHYRGKSLKDVIEEAIIHESKQDIDNAKFIVEKDMEQIPWCPSRVTLFNMRRDGKITEGVHYKKNGRFIFYNFKKMFDLWNKKEKR